MTDNSGTGSGKDRLFRDSKLGVIVASVSAAVFGGALDSLIEVVANTDLSHAEGWWTKAAAGALATLLGLLTAYKAKREKRHTGL